MTDSGWARAARVRTGPWLTALLLLMASCGAGTSAPQAPAPRQPTYNDTDVMFLQMMIEHHGPAGKMLDVAKARSAREQIRTLAAAVQVTQADETKTMTGWLQSWSEPLVSTAGAEAHAAHGGALPKGDAEIKALEGAAGGDFDRLFLTIFSGYQQTAVTLARMEINSGVSAETKQLAERIDKNRRAQIELMSSLIPNGS